MAERKQSSREFKIEALELWQTTDKSAREVEEALGISAGRLSNWRHQVQASGEQAFPGHGERASGDEEIRRLERELEIVRQERDI